MTSRRILGTLALAVAVGCGLPWRVWAADISANWLQPIDGDWIDGTKWSTAPDYPNNGTPVSSVYDAYVTASGDPYTVRLTDNVAVRSLTLGGTGTVLIYGYPGTRTLTLGQQLIVNSGARMLLGGGMITGGLISGGGYIEVEGYGWGILNNVTLASEIRVPDSTELLFEGTTSFASGGVVRLTGQGNELRVGADITGQGEIVFDGESHEIGNLRGPSSGPGIVTINPGIIIRTGSSSGQLHGNSDLDFVNQGQLRSETGRVLRIGGTLRNQNIVRATNGGTLSLFNWTNTGAVTADAGTIRTSMIPDPADLGTFYVHDGRFELGGPSTAARIQQLDIEDSVIALGEAGSADLGGGTLAVRDGTNVWRLAGGLLRNGTLTGGPLDQPLRVERKIGFGSPENMLDDIQLQADVTVDPGARLVLDDGVHVNARTLRLGEGPSNGNITLLRVNPLVTFDPGSRIVLDGADDSNAVIFYPRTVGVPTIPAEVEVVTGTGGGEVSMLVLSSVQSDSLVNAGRIASLTPGRTLYLHNEVENHGTIEATGGDVRVFLRGRPPAPLEVPTMLTSRGLLRLGVGGDLDVTGTLTLLDTNVSEFVLGGTGDEEFGQVFASQSIALDGSLRALLAPGYEPFNGDTFEIMRVANDGTLTGSFEATAFPTWGTGQTFVVDYSPTSVMLRVVPEPIALPAASVVIALTRRHRRRQLLSAASRH